jgi:hypothetical protein
MKQKIDRNEGENSSAVIVVDFNASLSLMDRKN